MQGKLLIQAEDRQTKTFDVICAGGALWKLATPGPFSTRSPRLGLRPGGGAVNVALALAREGLRIGLATVLIDDALGRRCFEKMAALGVDVGGVELARARSGFVLVDAGGGANAIPSDVEEQPPPEVP